LQTLRLNFEENGIFRLKIKTADLQSIFSRLKTKLSLVKIHSPSLEEAYLEIINQNENHDTA
jgi:hypothetical protein